MKEGYQAPASSFYAQAGDIMHFVTLASSLGFAFMAGTYMRDPNSTFFDAQWKQEGFCVTNRDVPYWNSHDMCLYVDTIMAVVAGLLFLALRNDPGMDRANLIFLNGIPGVLLHGFGHGYFGKAIREGTMNLEEGQKLVIETALANNETTFQLALSVLPLVAFWFALSKASMPNISNKFILLGALVVSIRQLWTSNDSGFTYTQTILVLQFSINELCRPKEEKDLAYFLYPTMVGLPLTLIGWMESTMCSTLVRDWFYGHLAYDAYIPLAMMAWYMVIHSQVSTTTTPKVKQL